MRHKRAGSGRSMLLLGAISRHSGRRAPNLRIYLGLSIYCSMCAMDSSLKPSPLLAEVLPGYTVLGVLVASYFSGHPDQWGSLSKSQNLLAVVTGLGAASFVAAWVLGTILDSVRDLVEELLDRVWEEVDWDFLFKAPESEIRKLDESWLAYYFLNGNYAIGLLIVLALKGVGLIELPTKWVWILGAVLALLVLDGGFLRRHVRNLIRDYNGKQPEEGSLPHEGVYTKLVCRKDFSHGVGVVAI